VGYSFAGAYAKNMIVSLPVSEVMAMAPPIPVPIDIGGRVELNLRDYSYSAPYCGSATGSLVMTSNSISTPIADLVIGPIIADFTCQDNKVEISGQQTSEQVVSGFSATLETDKRYNSQAWFTPQDTFPIGLADQLKWLSKPDAEGKYRFKYSGRL
jgi:general secretion pathway protein N